MHRFFLAACLLFTACASTEPRMVVRLVEGQARKTRYVSPSAYEHYLQGRIALDRGAINAALRHWLTAVLFDDSSPFLHTELSRLLTGERRFAEADQHLSRALAIDARYAPAHVAFAQLQIALGKPAAAAAAYEQAIALAPSDGTTYVGYAELKESQGQAQAAEAILERMVAQAPSAQAHAARGRFCIRRLRIACAAQALDQALAITPRSVELAFLRARVLRAEGKLTQAKLLLYRLFSRREAGPRIAEELLEVLAQLGQRPALKDFSSLLAQSLTHDVGRFSHLLDQLTELGLAALVDPTLKEAPLLRSSPAVVVARVRAALARGQVVAARSLVEQLPAGPYAPTAALLRAKIAEKAGDRKDAIRLLVTALAAAPDNLMLLRALIHRYQREQTYGAAVRLARAAVQRHPKRGPLVLLLAYCQLRSGDIIAALKTAEPLLADPAASAEVFNLVGYLLADKLREPRRAERLIYRALALRPLEAFAIDSLGWLRFRQGRTDEAITLLELAQRLAPRDAEVLAHLAEALQSSGKGSTARTLWHTAISLSPDSPERPRWQRALQALEAPKR